MMEMEIRSSNSHEYKEESIFEEEDDIWYGGDLWEWLSFLTNIFYQIWCGELSMYFYQFAWRISKIYM